MVEEIVKHVPSQGTRLKITLAIGVITTLAWLATAIAVLNNPLADNPDLLTQLQFVGVGFASWENTMTWILGIYGTTEVGAKGATAYMNR